MRRVGGVGPPPSTGIGPFLVSLLYEKLKNGIARNPATILPG